MTRDRFSAWGATETRPFLRRPSAESHKYSRGVLGVRTGSSAYTGAAVLTVEAAWRTGVGLVRYVPPLDDMPPVAGMLSPAAVVIAARPETVVLTGVSEARDCDAWVIGSGTNPDLMSFSERESLLRLLAGTAPVVVDAGALALVLRTPPRAPTVVTPHWGEFRMLWRGVGFDEDQLPSRSHELPHGAPALDLQFDAIARLSRALGATVMLKGSHTITSSPEGVGAVCGPATPWLATAGTGDVLAGVLAALLATHGTASGAEPGHLMRCAASAAVLHDAAARLASGDDGATGRGRPITALDVARALPDTIAALD